VNGLLVPLAPLLCLATLLALAPGNAAAMGAAHVPHPASGAAPKQKSQLPAVGSSVVVAFAPVGESELASAEGLSVGLMSATQGSYSTEQLLLDISQGARVASSAYSPTRPPALTLHPDGSGALVSGWQAALKRAEDAPQLLRPGLLAQRLPGGGGYAGVTGVDDVDGVLAADQRGRVAALSLGSAPSLLARVAALRESKRLVVCDLPAGAEALADIRSLREERSRGELLIVIQRTPDTAGHELLWAAAAGLPGGAGRELSSHTTNQRGLIASVDIAPTILAYLGLEPIPADMRGERLETDGALHSASLRSLMDRLRVVGGRRLTAFGCLLSAWVLLLLVCSLWPGARRRARRAWAMRSGALAVLWAPVAVLISAAIEPGAALEYLTITLACLALAVLTDSLLPWPRAPLAPAIVGVLALVIDALAGTQLLMRSLLGPNPILGARFYGFGNELKSGLAVLVLAALAGALYPAARGRRAALAVAGAGVLLAVVEGSARIGAGVGGVILVSAAFAVATVLLLPGSVTRKRALLILLSPLVALVALALLDLATAHGSGHFTGSVLHARSAGDLRDVIVRRYGAAWQELKNHAMPFATALALLCSVLGLRRRAQLLSPVGEDPAWLAALAGGVTAGVVGALSEDSGPVLLVVAVFTLGCVLTYLWGRPAPALLPSPTPRTPGTRRAGRSRALRRPAEPLR
jgi:hypothetical protein